MSTKRTRRGRQTTDDDSGESDTHTSIHPSDQGKGTGRHEDAEETQLESKLHGCKLANKLEARARDGREGKRSGDVPMQTTRLVKCVCVCVCVKRRESTTAARSKLAGMREDGTPVGDPSGATARSSSVRDCRRLVAHRSSLIAHGRGPEQPDHDRRVHVPTSTLARIVRRET